MKTTIRAYAKLNLTLDITGRRDDGYHLLETVMQSVTLHDTVTVRQKGEPGDISLTVTGESAPEDRTNTAWKAAEKFFEITGAANPGIAVRLDKTIPAGSGMAGGSADAAAVIIALDKLLCTGLSDDEKIAVAATVGADVPFCVTGGTALARGTGDILSFLPPLCGCHIVIARGAAGVSTKEAYRLFDTYTGALVRPDSEKMCEDICAGDIKMIGRRLCNVFEQTASAENAADIADIKQTMLSNGALGAALTGSGSAVFGIFDDEDRASQASAALRRKYRYVFMEKPAERGTYTED